jgi:archaemetzincin
MPWAQQFELLAIGQVPADTMHALCADLSAVLGIHGQMRAEILDPSFARHLSRGQFDSSEILHRMRGMARADARCLLGVTSLDLFIPILTFVFGEAELNGGCAIVSTHRLRQSFYGLPDDPVLERQRLLKEAVHELGHTFGLSHCEDYRCVMAPSHSVEWIDLKGAQFCRECSLRARHPHGVFAFPG